MLEVNEMKVLGKIFGKTEIEQEDYRSENPAVSNLLMSG